jgi:hypothetical protein
LFDACSLKPATCISQLSPFHDKTSFQHSPIF